MYYGRPRRDRNRRVVRAVPIVFNTSGFNSVPEGVLAKRTIGPYGHENGAVRK